MSYKFLCHLLTLDLSVTNRSQFFISQENGDLDRRLPRNNIQGTLFPISVGFVPLQFLPLLEANFWCSHQVNCQNKTKQNKVQTLQDHPAPGAGHLMGKGRLYYPSPSMIV